MSTITIRSPDGAEQHAVDEADWAEGVGEDNPYVGWTMVAVGAPFDPACEVVDGAWSLPLAVQQARLWERTKELRVERKAAGVTVAGAGQVQTDDVSAQNITGLVVMAQVAVANNMPFSEPFTMADNSVVDFDAPGMIAMGVAVGQYVAAVYARARDLRDAIFAPGITVEGLAAIDVESGWPQS